MKKLLIAASVTALLSACDLADRMQIPHMDVPQTYKEQSAKPQDTGNGMWKPVNTVTDAGAWWEIFGDEQLNQLERQAAERNETLHAAAARVEETRGYARSQAPTLIPDISVGANAVRTKPAAAGQAAFGGGGGSLNPYTLYEAQGVATYEIDLFGRVRSNYKGLLYDEKAARDAYRNVLLTLQADVAQHYFALRALDAERKLLRDTVDIRGRAESLMKKRLDQGDARMQDMENARADLAAAHAELAAVERQRAVSEHALAVLLGLIPSNFTFADAPLTGVPPEVPPGLPSALLERRPDVAAAVASMAAANERIGVARAAFFPILDLTASGGFESTSLGDLFTWPMRMWALGQLGGTALNWTLFDSGRRNGNLDRAHAVYEEAVANYRQQVLVAFRDVEDNLSDQRLLARQAKAADAAAQSASRVTTLTRRRFDEGDADYFEVVESQRNELSSQRAAIQTRGQRFITTVGLIRALGGGWGSERIAEGATPSPDWTQAIDPAAGNAAATHPVK